MKWYSTEKIVLLILTPINYTCPYLNPDEHIYIVWYSEVKQTISVDQTTAGGGGGGVQAAKIFFRPQFGLKIRGGVSPTPFPWFRHCKLTKSARYSLHSDKEAKMTHWTRYCATASFVYHSGNPILTLNLSPSRQPELLVGSTVKSFHKHTCKTDSSLNEHLTSVPNIF